MSRPPVTPRRRPERQVSPRRPIAGDHVVSPLDQISGSVGRVYAIPGYALLPLRLFLGITFLYAGFQKLNDPGFFSLGAPTYIGTQLLNFSHNSPIQFLLKPMLEHAVPLGYLTIATELAVGFAVLIGMFTRLAALVGLMVNLVLFLSASWSVYPYFLGSDIIFVAAWATLFITGPGGFCLDSVIAPMLQRRYGVEVSNVAIGPLHDKYPEAVTTSDQRAPRRWTHSPGLFSRRTALMGGAASIGLFILGIAPRATFGGSSKSVAAGSGGSSSSGTAGGAGTSPTSGAAGGSGTSPTPATSGGSPSGKSIAQSSQIPVNSAFQFTDPKSGDPGVVVHTSAQNFYAYDAVCTHAGCTVQYDPSTKLLVCPCHGGAFDPAQNASVVAGPPPAPLTALPITVDASGNIVLA